MPNLFATFALLVWPIVALVLYANKGVVAATIWTIMGAQLLLPVGAEIKFDMVPAFDKASIPSLAALLGCLIFWPRSLRGSGRFGLAECFMAVYVLIPFVTAAFNQDALTFGKTYLPPSSYYDALSAAVSQLITITPLILGRSILRGARSMEAIMVALAVAGLAYSLPLLFEIRMSPQLHVWVYGNYPSDFIQTMREGGGFRPMAFMGHGLAAALFIAMSTVASASLWQSGIRFLTFPSSWITAYLGALLVLCKSGAALIYAAALVPFIKFLSSAVQIRIAVVLVSLALLYPVLRLADWVPTTTMVETARMVGDQRADSLNFRFFQEGRLLERASQRPFFGWGRFGRGRVFDEYGRDISVTDGRWIITMGQFGLVGFLAEFGLLALGIFRCISANRIASNRTDRILLSALALIVSINIVNLLPNSALPPLTWLLAGALLGRAEAIKESVRYRMRKQKRMGMEQVGDAQPAGSPGYGPTSR